MYRDVDALGLDVEEQRHLALANKESLVAGGHIVTQLAKPGQNTPNLA